jgi:beta propeller repeat protein
MKNKVLVIFLVFFSFVVLATVASAGKETQLTNGERLTQRTSTYGDYVFWTESTANDVHAFNLTTGKQIDISGDSATDQINTYADKVVWTGADGDAVYIYDISTGNETKISSAGRNPDIYGNYVVYTNNYYSDQDHQNDSIYLYDLNAQKETKIAKVYSSPAIYDTKVVWSQTNGNNSSDILEYNISTKQTSIMTTTNNPISESELDIYGNIVVWAESGNIYMYDIASHNKTQITNSGDTYQPAIYGDRIVYTVGDSIADNTDIYMYEISNARTTRITNSSKAFAPSIYADRIVYADWRNSLPETSEGRDIYIYDLHPENEKLKAVFVATDASGNAPLNVSFRDISSGMPNTWYWDFGDGTNSTQQNTNHTYSSAGNYTALLKVSDANGTDSMSVTINVLKPVPLVANFSTNVTKGYAPLTVQFTDLSENAKAWYWEFGDGTFDNISSLQQNPLHTYYSAGNYTVNLTISDLIITNSTSSTITVL